jgi:hypothetical protein
MFEIYLACQLTTDDLIACDFSDDDISEGLESQIDFIIVSDYASLPQEITRNLKHLFYDIVDSTFRGESKTIFIFWH